MSYYALKFYHISLVVLPSSCPSVKIAFITIVKIGALIKNKQTFTIGFNL